MKLTLGQAAKLAGVSKGTISNALKNGRMSGTKNDKGQFEIDPAELYRVFPKRSEASNLNAVAPPKTDAVAQVKIEALEREIELLKSTVDDLRNDRDEWRKQSQTLALTDQRAKSGGFFGLFRKGAA